MAAPNGGYTMKWLVMNDDGDIFEFFPTQSAAMSFLTQRVEEAGGMFDEEGYPTFINGLSMWQMTVEVQQIPFQGIAVCPVKL
jgi:hypothetical protein